MNWRSSISIEKARVRRMKRVNGMDPLADESLSSTFSRIFSITCLLRYVRMPIGNFLTSIYIRDNYSNLNNIYRVYKIVARIVLLENREINNAAIARGS